MVSINKIFLILSLILLFFSGCNLSQNNKQENIQGVANPASVFCSEHNGTLEIISSPEGEEGICKFNDGSFCEEWSFYNGNCSKSSRFN